MGRKKEERSVLKHLTIIISILLSVYLAYFVLAQVGGATSAGVKVLAPTTYLNLSSNNATFLVNCSYINSTDVVTPNITHNTTFYINDTGTWRTITGVINTTAYSSSINAVWVTVDTTALTDANFSVAINCTLGNATATAYVNYTNMTTQITIDDTPPAVDISIIAGINYSKTAGNTAGGLVRLNATVTDAVKGVRTTIMFNLSNASNKQELLIVATLNTSTIYSSTGMYSNLTKLNITPYTEGNYTIQVLANDTLNNVNSSKKTTIWFDSTIPLAYAANISKPQADNYSQNMVLNISVIDTNPGVNSSGIGSVLFLLINGTGGTNATYAASREGTTTRWSRTINSSHLKDNNYSVTVYVNDSAGNTNKSAATPFSFFVDNSGPSLIYACSSSSVTEGETITCTCSGSDTWSGVNASTLSFTASPPTGSTGTFPLQCSGSDNARNGAVNTISYTVSGAGGTTSGGGGGSSAIAEAKTAQTWAKVTPEEAITMKNFASSYGLKQIQIEVNNEVQNVKVTVTKYDSKPAAVSVSKEGKVYKYLKIDTENLATKLSKATITVQVPQSWITSNTLDKDNLAVFKFTGTEWKELTTKYKEADATNYYYTADVTAFSYFAIGQKIVTAEEEAALPSPTAEETAAEQAAAAAAEAKSWLSSNVWLGIFIIAIIAAAIAYVVYRKKYKY